jgi:hypothetical protein
MNRRIAAFGTPLAKVLLAVVCAKQGGGGTNLSEDGIMFAKTKICCALALLTAVIGCIPSLNPVYRIDDLIFDPSVLGVWRQVGEKARWDFSKRDDRSYRLVYTDNEGRQGRFVAHLAKIEGEMFLDLFPEEVEVEANDFYRFHLVPVHTIYRVRQTSPNLELAAIDYKWLDAELNKQPPTIQSSTFNGRRLITASTEEVRSFVVQNKEAFTAMFRLEKLVTD